MKTIQAKYLKVSYDRRLLLRLGVAGVLVVMILAQLMAFEVFPDVIEALLPGSLKQLSQVVAVVVVCLEVAAVPSLVIVPLSRLARSVSQIAGLAALMMWYGLIFSGMLRTYSLNSGILGEKVFVPANFASLVFVVILFVSLIFIYIGDRRLSLEGK